MKRLKLLVAVAATILFVGCTATQSVSLSSQTSSGKKVSASVSQFNFLALTPMSLERASEVIVQLNQKCGGTGVNGISTKTKGVWLLIGVNEIVEATGYCN